MGRRIFILILLAAILLFVSIAFLFGNAVQRKDSLPKIEPTIKTGDKSRIEIPRVSIIASDLEIPWGLAFLPDGSILFTERPGQVRMIDIKGNFLPSPVANILEVKHIGEGGLLGIAIHPSFKNNKHIYLYYTYSSTGNNTLNRVARFNFENGTLVHEQVIVDAIPGAINHNGGRIKFGPDNFLYITTGDAQNPSLAQDVNSLAGKILRVTDEGKPASDNPFDNLVYSYGHRNPQGFTWDNNGRLWATEHGPQARDELNLIEKGANYGWPVITGNEEREGMKKPVFQSGDSTWAPAGLAFVNDSLFFGGLRGQALYETKTTNNPSIKEHFKGEFGRIREVIVGLDNMLYITTSNRDGRGTPNANDDKVIRVNPSKL